MNFLGVLIGDIAVAYALVKLMPAEVLTPPDGGPAPPLSLAVIPCPAQGAAAYFRTIKNLSLA